MEDASLGVLIVGAIVVIWLIQAFIWTVMILRNPSFDYMRFERRPARQAGSSKPR